MGDADRGQPPGALVSDVRAGGEPRRMLAV